MKEMLYPEITPENIMISPRVRDEINADFDLEQYSYFLPEELIAQHPAKKRDQSRLLVLDRENLSVKHRHFVDVVEYLNPGDLLVINNTKVFPARLFGQKQTGGKAEVFLLEYPKRAPESDTTFVTHALIKASKRPKPGSSILINDHLSCTVLELFDGGKAFIEIHSPNEEQLVADLEQAGQVPLPPYISREKGTTEEDRRRYQTVYARTPGAVAAPTAGLHFTEELMTSLRQKGIDIAEITLHVGYGTFAPVREQDIRQHQIHSEYLTITQKCVKQVKKTKTNGGKVWAVGTTSVRSLEFGAKRTGELEQTEGWCDLYIYPGFKFNVVDNLITNFHLPNSSLMFLVSAFIGQNTQNGREALLSCYREAVEKRYHFFSYGDAMAIITPRK